MMLLALCLILTGTVVHGHHHHEPADDKVDVTAVCGRDRSICDPEFDKQHKPQYNLIWNNIVNQGQMLNSARTDFSESPANVKTDHYIILNTTTKSHDDLAEKSTTSEPNSRNPRLSSAGSSIEMMQKNFKELFMHTRHDKVSTRLKNLTRHGIIDRLSHYTLETTTQEFFAKAPNGEVVQGMNIVGVIPGRNRNKPGDEIILIGAHYDSDANTPGVDDNGSGVVAMLEIARILSPYMGQLSSSVFLVAFDLEENGILGSLAFVNNYLIPNELVSKRTHFLGAYILEMVLNYDNSSQSQILPLDMVLAVPESALWLQMNGNRGDFVGLWSRKVLDYQISNAFTESWRKVNEERNRTGIHTILPDLKLYNFDAAIPRDPLLLSTVRYRAFFNSDHASFWTHRSPEYSDYLSAVLITDMGAHRGNMRACYHEFCDDGRHLTGENLEFMKRITDAVANSVLKLSS
jgi:hypothetical protein